MCKLWSAKVSYLASAGSGRVSQCGLTLWGTHSRNQPSKLVVCWVVLLVVAMVHWHLDTIMSSFLFLAVRRHRCALEDPGCIGLLRCTKQIVSQACHCASSYFVLSFLVSTSGVTSPEISCSPALILEKDERKLIRIWKPGLYSLKWLQTLELWKVGLPINTYSGGW